MKPGAKKNNVMIDNVTGNKNPPSNENCIKVSRELIIFRANLTCNSLSSMQSAQSMPSLHNINLENYGCSMADQDQG